MEPLEGRTMESYSLGHYSKPYPVFTEELDRPGYHTLSFQDIKVPVSIQGVIHLLEIQENFI